MAVLYGLNTYNGDFDNYKNVYDNLSVLPWHYEVGYSSIMHICRWLRFTFYSFRVVLAIITICLLYSIIKQYTNYMAFALACYMLFPFIYFSSVVRAGISGLIVAYAFKYLLTDKRVDRVKYCMAVAVSMCFHFSSVIFFGLLLAKKRMSAKEYVFIFLSSLLLYILVSENYIYTLLSAFTNRPKILAWFRNMETIAHPNLNGIIAILFRVLGNIFLVFLARVIYNRNTIKVKIEGKNFADLLFSANVLMLSIVPLLMYADSFLRVIYVVMILNACLYARTFELIDIKRKMHRKTGLLVYPVAILSWHLAMLILMNLTYVNTENSVWLIFSNNLLLKTLQ